MVGYKTVINAILCIIPQSLFSIWEKLYWL